MGKPAQAAAAAAVSFAFIGMAQSRDLPAIDALASAPQLAPEAQAKAARADPRFLSASFEERLGVPSMLWLRPGAMPQAKARGLSPEAAARDHLKAFAPLYRITAADVGAAPLVRVETLDRGATLARFASQRDGIEVFRESASVLMDAALEPVAISGALGGTPGPVDSAKAPALAKVLPGRFALDPAKAVAAALADYGFEAAVAAELRAAPARRDAVAQRSAGYAHFLLPTGRVGPDGARFASPARAKPVWFRLPDALVPAYYVELDMVDPAAGSLDAYAYVVAADDARVLFRHNLTADDAYTYRAFAETGGLRLPLPSPQGRGVSPHPTGLNDGFVPPFVAPALVTLQNGPISTNDPWLPPGATRTIGNNVEAWANRVGPAPVPPATDAFDGTFDPDPNECNLAMAPTADIHACVTSAGSFDHAFDPTLAPSASKSQIMAAVTSLFYTTNWLHDWFYDAGFREADGNAQDDNYGRGGLGGDSMRVQAQDYSGFNNANMGTFADGGRPRMRMYIFTGTGNAVFQGTSAPIIGNFTTTFATAWGPQNFDVSGQLVQALDASDGSGPLTTDGCSTLTNPGAVAGRIAVIDRGTCNFTVKVKNAQNAGAIGVLVANSASGAFNGMGGTDPTITIPALMVTNADGAAVKAAVAGGATTGRLLRVTGVNRDGTVDNGIVAHEWGHYLSNRLIANAAGLSTNQARGLGEGWSDFVTLLMIVKEGDALVASNAGFNGVYPVGGYPIDGPQLPGITQSTANYYGIRRYPYSRDLAKNPLAFQHIQTAVALPASPPPSGGGDNAEVHNTGEVWASMLWQCYSNLLRDTGRITFDQAQGRMKRYLVTGLKLTPPRPTFVEARDALLAAMAAMDPADMAQCLAGFATRGMGLRAQFTGDRFGTTNAGLVESFTTGSDLELGAVGFDGRSALYCDADAFLDNGESARVGITVRNSGIAAVSGGTLTLSSTSPAVTFPAGASVPIPTLQPMASTTVSVEVALAGAPAVSAVSITATASAPSLALGPTATTFTLPVQRDRAAGIAQVDDVEDASSPWTVTVPTGADAAKQWRRLEVYAHDHRWMAPGSELAGVTWLTSPSIQVAASGTFSLSFTHRHAFEFSGSNNFDAGVIEVSQDDGVTWADVETVIGASTVYNGAIAAASASDSPFPGRRAFVRQSAGYPALATTTVTFPAALLGKTVRVRFGASNDTSGTFGGWEVDDIAFGGIVNAPFPGPVNDAAACVTATATQGTPQSATAGQAFATALQVRVMAGATPVPGATVRFTAPSSGASGTFMGQASASAVTDASGFATVAGLTANAIAGTYNVVASAGLQAASFALTNVAVVTGTLEVGPGTLDFGPQSVGTTSGALVATLTNTTSTAMSLAIATPAGFLRGGTCGATLAASASCTLSMRFAPPANGYALNQSAAVEATLSITTGTPGSPFTVQLKGVAEQSLVRHYYRSILRRDPDLGGLAFWQSESARLAGLGANVNEAWFAMAAAFYASAEYVSLGRDDTGFITDLYNTFFNRAPDGGGLAFWLGQLQGGLPREVPLNAFMFSAEFVSFTQAIFGNTAARPEVDMAGDLYRGILGRLPDSAGLAYWVGQLRSAQCSQPPGGRVAAVVAAVEALSSGFLNGPEFVNRNRGNRQFVGDLYNAFLRRGGDLAGVLFWIGSLDDGSQTRESERRAFINTPEFAGRVYAVIDAGCLP